MPGVDLLVHFDIPWNPEVLALWQGRTQRAGQTKPFTVLMLRDESGALESDSILGKLDEKMKAIAAQLGPGQK